MTPSNNHPAWSTELGRELEAEEEKLPEIKVVSPKKRKVMTEEKRTPKKKRRNMDMKRYISCKKWKEEEKDRQQRQDTAGGEQYGH